jgi:2'-5' RNA ligase
MENGPSGSRINLYALVTYLPGSMGRFLNQLRQELVPNCHLRAHVTVLPPRQIQSQHAAARRLQAESRQFEPVYIELGDVEVFPITSVIFLSIRRGHHELVEMHSQMAQNELAFAETYEYHPHITLAQGLAPSEVAAAVDHAKRRWREYEGPRSFVLDSMTFVQSTAHAEWIDLGEFALGSRVPA